MVSSRNVASSMTMTLPTDVERETHTLSSNGYSLRFYFCVKFYLPFLSMIFREFNLALNHFRHHNIF